MDNQVKKRRQQCLQIATQDTNEALNKLIERRQSEAGFSWPAKRQKSLTVDPLEI